MKYYYELRAPSLKNAELLRVERNKMNPIHYGSFVSIAYYRLGNEIIGIVF